MPAESQPFADDTMYDVKLAWVVVYDRSKYLPLPVHVMSGKILKAIIDQEGDNVLDSAQPH
jgi:hypothetical protein